MVSMKTLGVHKILFPETLKEAETWVPLTPYTALASKVLVVARARQEGTWSAYCNAVPGQTHDREFEAVLEQGDKIRESIARVLFPIFEGIPYAN